MEDADYEAVTKKLEELRVHIPLLESHISTIKGNPEFQEKYEKLVKLKNLLTSGRPKLKLLLRVEGIISQLSGNKNKQSTLPNNFISTRIKLENPETLTIKTEPTASTSIQSPESPPLLNDFKKDVKPINIPIEREEGRHYSYERDYRTSDRSYHRHQNVDKDYRRGSDKYHRSTRDYKEEYYDRRSRSRERSRDRSRSRSREWSRDRRSRSREWSRDRRSRSRERYRRSRSRERSDSRSDYRYKDHYEYDRKYIKTEREYGDRSSRNFRSQNEPSSNQSVSPVNRTSVFTRIGPKMFDSKPYKKEPALKNKRDEIFQADIIELERANQNRFGISDENKALAEDVAKLNEMKNLNDQLQREIKEKNQEEILRALRSNKFAKHESDLCNTSNIGYTGLSFVSPSTAETQNREPSSAHISSNANMERFAYKYNQKIRPSLDIPESNNGNVAHYNPTRISSNMGIIENDPRLRNRDRTVFTAHVQAPPAPVLAQQPAPPTHVNNQFNQLPHVNTMQMPCTSNAVNQSNLRHINLNNAKQYNELPPFNNPMIPRNIPGSNNTIQNFHSNISPDNRRTEFMRTHPPLDFMEQQQPRKPTYKDHRIAREKELEKHKVSSTEEAISSTTSSCKETATMATKAIPTSATAKTARSDNASRCLDGNSKAKSSFKIPKLNKAGNSTNLNKTDTEKSSAKVQEQQTNNQTVNENSALAKKCNIEVEKTSEAESTNKTEAAMKSKKKRRQSTIESDSGKDTMAVGSEATGTIDSSSEVKQLSPQPQKCDQADATSSTSTEKAQKEEKTMEFVFDMMKTVFSSNNPSMLVFFEKMWDKDKVNQMKALFDNSDRSKDNNDTVVSSSTTTTVAVETDNIEKGKPSIEPLQVKPAKRPQKKKSNELTRLNDDIRTMFICDGVLNATGKRMCTLMQTNQSDTSTKTKVSPKAKPSMTATTKEKDSKQVTEKLTLKTTPKSISHRRNTLAQREQSDSSDVSSNSELPPKSKRIMRRRDTVCEVIEHTSNSDDGMPPPIKLKFTMSATSNSKKQKNSVLTESDADVEYGQGNKNANEDIKYKTKAKITIKKTAAMQKEDILKNIQSKSVRSGLARDCRVVLEKMDIPQRVTRAQKRSSEQVSVELSEDSNDSLLIPAKKQCDVQKPEKNTNPDLYIINPKYGTNCLFCPFKHHNGMVTHHVNRHPEMEVYISRPSPEMANKMRKTSQIPKSINRKYIALCYFCETEQTLTTHNWVRHLIRHTGEFERICKNCNTKFVEKIKKSQKCDHLLVEPLNIFNFDESIDVYMCNLCNYTQFNEDNLKKHIRNEHEISSRAAGHYKKITLLDGLRKRDKEKESDDTASEKEEPVNPDVFKSSKQDDGLFDSDTMKLMNEVTFNETAGVNKSNSFTMINKLSERFRKQTETETETETEAETQAVLKEEIPTINIFYKSSEDDTDDPNDKPKNEEGLKEKKRETDNGSEETHTNAQAIQPDSDQTNVNQGSLGDDNGDWESCSSDSTEEISNEKEAGINKNVLITNTLNRLYRNIVTGKSKTKVSSKSAREGDATSEEIKEEKGDTETAEQHDSEVNSPATKTLQRANNLGFSECKGTIEYCCFIGHCNLETKDLRKFVNHLPQHRQGWDGFCHACDKQLYNQSMSLTKELNHLKTVHLEKYLESIKHSQPSVTEASPSETTIPSSNVQQKPPKESLLPNASESESNLATTPLSTVIETPESAPIKFLKVRRLPGDTLSGLTSNDESNNSSTLSGNQMGLFQIPNIPLRQGDISGNEWLRNSLGSSSLPPPPQVTLPIHNVSTSINSNTALQSNNAIINDTQTNTLIVEEDNLLKPWTKCQNLKSKEDTEKMLQQTSLINLYKCMALNCTFTTPDSKTMVNHLGNHEEAVYQPTMFDTSHYDTSSWLECSYCEDIADSCRLLVNHINTEHIDSIYQCGHCFYRAVTQTHVIRHCELYHANLQKLLIVCEGAAKQTANEMPNILQNRIRNVKPINCANAECNQSFYVLAEFMHHINNTPLHTQQNRIDCFICKESIERMKAAKHLLSHNIGLFQCIYCTFGTADFGEIKVHLSDSHPTKLALVTARIRGGDLRVPVNDIEATLLVDITEEPPANTVTAVAGSLQNRTQPSTRIVTSVIPAQGSNVIPLKDLVQKFKVHSGQKYQPQINTINTLNAKKMSTSTQPTASTSAAAFSITPSVSNQGFVLVPTTSNQSVSPASTSSTNSSVSTARNSIEEEIDLAAQSLLKNTGLEGQNLYRCGANNCNFSGSDANVFNVHLLQHSSYRCYHCSEVFNKPVDLKSHIKIHGIHRFLCNCCNFTAPLAQIVNKHFSETHKQTKTEIHPLNPKKTDLNKDIFYLSPQCTPLKNFGIQLIKRNNEILLSSKKSYLPSEATMLPHQQIYTEKVSCSLCQYSTKVRANIYRHLIKGDCVVNKTIPGTDPINPVPCLDSGEKHFDKMFNLAASSNPDGTPSRDRIDQSMQYIPTERRFVCGARSCHYQNNNEDMLKQHVTALHASEKLYNCPHCNKELSNGKTINASIVISHLRFHGSQLFKCPSCQFYHYSRIKVDKHMNEIHPKCKDKILELVRQQRKQTDDTASSVSGSGNGSGSGSGSGSGKNGNAIFKWKCNVCFLTKFDTRKLVRRHLQDVHRLQFEYQCTICSFQNDVKGVVKDHIVSTHNSRETDKIKTFYERIEGASDVTPIWQRNDPTRIKHIRGILLEEEEINVEDEWGDNVQKVSDDNNKMKTKPTSESTKTKVQKPLNARKRDGSNCNKNGPWSASSSNLEATAIDNTIKNTTPSKRHSADINSDEDVQWIPPKDIETICIDDDNIEQNPPEIVLTHKINEKLSSVLNSGTNDDNSVKKNKRQHQQLEEIPPSLPPPALKIHNKQISSLSEAQRNPSQSKAAAAFTICTICHKKIPATISLEQHFETTHQTAVLDRSRNIYIYICYHCEFSDENFDKLFNHWMEHHKSSKLSIPSTLMNETKGGRPFWYKISKLIKCFFCMEKFTFNQIRTHHQQQHPTERCPVTTTLQNSLQCGHCDITCRKSVDLKKHYIDSHQTFYGLQLEIEPLNFLTQPMLSTLVQQGYLYKTKCMLCQTLFHDRLEFNEHHKMAHSEKEPLCVLIDKDAIEYGCSVCRESFIDEEEALKHIRSHNLQYMCKFCDKIVNYLKLIKSHYEITHDSTDVTYRNVNVRENLSNYLSMTITFANGLTLTKADLMNTNYGDIDKLIAYLEKLDADELNAIIRAS